MASAFFISFIITIAITPFVIKISSRHGLLDYPKKESLHTYPVSIMGGSAIFFVFFILNFIFNQNKELIPLFVAALPLLISGIYDDLNGLSAKNKLMIQVISTMTLIPFGIIINEINIPFWHVIKLGIFSVPFTIIWFIALINLINIIDGLDGLAAGLCAIILYITMLYTYIPAVNIQIAILLGAVLGFTIFNFYPAKIFLGNSGSMLLGFFIAYFSLITSQKSTIAPLLLLPCSILIIHILDLAYSIVRRAKDGVSIFRGDKKHLHYLALNIIRNHRLTVLVFYFLSILFAFMTLKILFS